MSTILVWVLLALCALWALHTIVVIYHWLRYSQHLVIAYPAIGVHLVISFALLSYAFSGFLPI